MTGTQELQIHLSVSAKRNNTHYADSTTTPDNNNNSIYYFHTVSGARGRRPT